MSVFGIICEFNPIHIGHLHLINSARAMGAEAVVCVMSGNTVQRGEFAVVDQYTRAEAAVRAGADLVLSLPFPWCSGSAEAFAMGGVEIVKHFADTLIFGSECGNVELLHKAAQIASTDEFRLEFQERLEYGEQAASAYHALLQKKGISELSSNDILGVAYLRAAIEQNASLSFRTIARQGANYCADTLSASNDYPSALAIRKLWREQQFAKTQAYLPESCAALYRKAYENGTLTDAKELDNVWLSFFRLQSPDTLAVCAGAEGGLAQRICAAANEATSTEELIEKIRTKRYTDAHLRRTMLFCLADVRADDLKAKPSYTTLLAANERGRALLSQKRKENDFPVVTKPADAPKDSRQYQATQKIDSIFALATKSKQPAYAMMTHTPYIEKN